MLVRILAMGLTHPLWKNVFHHLRAALPRENFAAGFFSNPDELAFLEQEYFPHQWRREPPDLILTDAGAPAEWKRRLAFLSKAQALEARPAPVMGLVVHTIRHGLRQLVQMQPPVTFHLEHDARVSLADPGLLIDAFPDDYPRLRLNPHLTALRLPRSKGGFKEVRPHALPVGTLLGFSQIEAIVSDQEAMPPQDWLKRVLKAERVHMPRGHQPALYREPGGLFLFPGVPTARVRGVSVAGLAFPHLIDLGMLTETSPGFVSFAREIEQIGRRRAEALETLNRRLREYENRADLPICCAGGVPALNRIVAERLVARGYLRARAAEGERWPVFEEPTLLLEPTPRGTESPPQREEPLVLSIAEDLAPELALLDGLLPWREIGGDYSPKPLERAAFLEERERLSARGDKARTGLDFTTRRLLLVEQETRVLEGAEETLSRLIAPGVQVWEGVPPARARQALVLSFDGEEAQVVFQSMPGVPKRRWFDIAPCLDPDSCHGLNLRPLAQYARGGALFITPQARERVLSLRERWRARREESLQALEDARTAERQYREELARIGESQRELALRWMHATVERWLDVQERRILAALSLLRPRHEQSWFHRGQVNRIVVIAAQGDSRKSLVEACREIYPHFNQEHSTVIPYDYEPLDALGATEREAVLQAARAEELSAAQTAARVEEILRAENERLLESYLDVVVSAVAELPRVDLLLIEQRPEVAARLIDRLRGLSPVLEQATALLIFPDDWPLPPEGHLPWPRVRVVPIRRMGTLAARDCARLIRALYAL
jgi:hypothetical protein